MGNYCHSGETKQEDDNASEKSDTKSEHHDQSYSQDQTQKEAIYLEEKISTENKLQKTDCNSLSNSPLTPTLECLPSLPSSLHVLYGNPHLISKVQKQQKIVFYILTPFSGQSVEKEIFLKCFEYINRKYQCSDFEMYLCDLHEDVDTSESKLLKTKQQFLIGSEGHEQAANCMAAISKYINSCYLVPILMLYNSVGEILLPLSFELQDFLNLLEKVEKKYPTDKKLIEKWYQLDKNCRPECYRLQLKGNNFEQKELHHVLNILTEVLSLELSDLYLTTIVEQEINHTILINQDVAKRCLWIQNTSDAQNNSSTSTIDKETLRRISNIRQELSLQLADNQIFGSTFVTSAQKDQLELALQTSLCNIVENVMDDYNSKIKVPSCTNGIDRHLLTELDNVDCTIKSLIQNRANMDILDNIKSFIKSDSKHLMIVQGNCGAGKTTLIAKIAENINLWKPNTLVITRFCKTSYYKCSPLMFLRSVVEQLSVLVKNKPFQIYDNDMEAVILVLKELLTTNSKDICFLIDDFHAIFKKEDIEWLKFVFAKNLKCVITLPIPEDPKLDLISTNDFQFLDGQKIEILIMRCSEMQWKDIITHGVGDICTTGSNVNLLSTWSNTDERVLVKAKILWWLAWLGVTDLPEVSLRCLSFKVLEVLENLFGEETVSFIIPIISASRSGLHESEIIELMKAKSSNNSEFVHTHYLWGKFSWVCGSLLSNEKNVYFIDSIVRSSIKEKYQKEIAQAHITLFEYYTLQPEKYQLDTFERWNVRKFHELPYQSSIIDSENFSKSAFITDLSWIQSKIECLGICAFIEDTLLCKTTDLPHVKLLCQIINKNYSSLSYDAQQIYSHVHQLLEKNQINCVDLNIKQNWTSSINSQSIWLNPRNTISDEKSELYSYDIALNLSCPGNFVVMLSKQGEELCVWDVERCTKVRVIKNVPQPQSLCLVGEYCVAVLCNREIKLIDVDKGKHIITLKGVMNQKMPYFAVHDSDHIVCLSRNRMYVNLMNLKSGDCITTFKAGEDRFLNSLLLSGDGRILVCGDETSKPFPLLVWNLTQRKLLYDLRIPHHEFLTALSAITHEGSYVAVVAKEIVEPSPNFIVVYDLQSGTLFKKWKPTCNTVSLSISQKNMCVIAGLEDAKILMWDLVTGNCRGTLIGHIAPVTLLNIDSSGKILLSGDQECRDQSIRIWELNTGAHLASYTPKRNILACELSSNGRYVILTFQGCSSIQTLELKGIEQANISNASTFGNSEFEGKTFDLKM